MKLDPTKLLLAGLLGCALSLAALAGDADPAAPPKDKTSKDAQTTHRNFFFRTNGDDPEVIDLDDIDEPGKGPGPGGPVRVMRMPGKRGFLGVSLVDLTPELRAHFGVPDDAGVMVSQVEPDSPAAKAGVKVGDIISGIGGKKVDSSWSLTGEVRRKKDGEAATLEVWRDRKVQTLTANVVVREKRMVDMNDVIVNMGGEGPYHFKFDQERIDEMTRNLRERFDSPEFKARIEHQKALEQKMQELEKKLQDLEKKLQEKGR